MTEIRLNEMKYWMERKIHHRKGVNSSELFGFENVHFSRNDVSPFFSCTIFRYTIIHIAFASGGISSYEVEVQKKLLSELGRRFRVSFNRFTVQWQWSLI